MLPVPEAELGDAELQAAQTIRGHHTVTFSSGVFLGASWQVSVGIGWAGKERRRLLCWQPARQRVRQSCLLCRVVFIYLFFKLAAGELRTGIRKLNYLPLADEPKHILWQKS